MLNHPDAPRSLDALIAKARLAQAMRAFPGYSELFERGSMVHAAAISRDFDSQALARAIHDRLLMDGIDLDPWKEERLRFYPPPGRSPDALANRLWAAQRTSPQDFPKLSHPAIDAEITAWIRASMSIRDLACLFSVPPAHITEQLTAHAPDWLARDRALSPVHAETWLTAVLDPIVLQACPDDADVEDFQALRTRVLTGLPVMELLAAIKDYGRAARRLLTPTTALLKSLLTEDHQRWQPLFQPTRIVTKAGSGLVIAPCSLDAVAQAIAETRTPLSPIIALGRTLATHPVLITDLDPAEGYAQTPQSSLLLLTYMNGSPGYGGHTIGHRHPRSDDLATDIATELMMRIYRREIPITPTPWSFAAFRQALDLREEPARSAYRALVEPYWPGGDLYGDIVRLTQ